MVEEAKKLTSKDFPVRSLGYLFPTFESFYKELKPNLGFVSITIIKKVDENDKTVTDWVETRERGLTSGLGILAMFIAKNFYLKFRSYKYVGEQREYVDEFLAELAMVVAEIRRKEHVWSQVYRENIEKWTKIETKEIHSGTDSSGKKDYDNKTKSAVLGKDLVGQEKKSGNQSGWDQSNEIITRSGVNYAPLGKILSSLSHLNFDFPTFYERFYRLYDHHVEPPSLEWIIDPTTGRRKWVTEEEYEKLVEPEKKTSKKLGLDPHDVLKEYFDTGNWEKYLEALNVYHQENEKEHDKLPETSNRRPRVAIRIKYGEKLLKGYQKELKRGGDFKLITAEEFLARIRGEREGFSKVTGYENIIELVARWLKRWHFYQKWGGEKPQQLMIGLLGDPGLGKTYICQAIGKALGNGYYRISLNGKNSSSIIYGNSIENPGAEMGGIVKAMAENKSQFTVLFFDEIEKASKEAKDAIGEPTDRTGNSEFKDALYDFITPCNNLIFFCALNYSEELPDFIRDRFTMIQVNPPSYQQRIEILRALLMGSLKKFDEPFQGIWHKKWEEIYNIFNQEALLKKALTKTMSIRGAKDNIASLINIMVDSFLNEEKDLPHDVVNYNWEFRPKEELDIGDKRRGRPACPWAEEKSQKGTSDKEHRKGCKCFVNNLDKVLGWKENMGDFLI